MQDLTGLAGQSWAALEPRAAPAPVEVAWAEPVEDARFNPNHAPVGPGGGEFTSGGGGGGGGAGKQAAGKQAQQKAAEKKKLEGEAAADRAKAHQLEQTLAGLEKQQKAAAATSAAAAKTAKGKAAAAGHINPHAKKAAPGKAHHQTAQTRKKKAAKLASQIAGLKQQISTLLSQASQLDAKAKKL